MTSAPRFLARLILAAALIAIPATGFSQQISGIKVEPETAQAGEPVEITVTFDVDGGINCGIAVLFSDGVAQDYKITSREQVPLVITLLSTPGRTVTTVEPKNQGLLPRCSGRSKTAAFMVAAPASTTVAAAAPRQESVAVAPAQGGQVSAAPPAAYEQRAAAVQSAPAVEGDFVDNKRTGRGARVWPNGDRYEGDWVNGERHGRGTMVYVSGARYDGEWQYNTRTGTGTLVSPNGSRYEGSWATNRRSGQGSLTFPDGGRYQGGFVEDKFQGRGTFTWANGQQYSGDWLEGQRTGRGTYTWPNGDRYAGDFVDGKMNTGTMTRANGARQEYSGGVVAQQYAPPAAAPAPAPRASSEPRERDNSGAIEMLSGILGGVAASRQQQAARPSAPAPSQSNSAATAAALSAAVAPSTNYYQQPERHSGPSDTRTNVAAGPAASSKSGGSSRPEFGDNATQQMNASNCVDGRAVRADAHGGSDGRSWFAVTNRCNFEINMSWCLVSMDRDRMHDCSEGLGTWGARVQAGETTVVYRPAAPTRWSSAQWFACRREANGVIYTQYQMRPGNPPKGQCIVYGRQ